MDEKLLRRLAQDLVGGRLSVDDFLVRLKELPYLDMGDVKLDTHRALRKAFPEVVYCPGKSDDQLLRIAEAVAERDGPALFSRATEAQYAIIRRALPEAEYFQVARLVAARLPIEHPYDGVVVASAGSSDVPVAEEAAIVAIAMGCKVKRIYDIGVAGLHRLLAHIEELQSAKVVVAVAGMDGALPSVIGGIVSCPVIAVPTSVGYGASFGGLAALLTMLNACASGISVVNIDNGLGGGYCAALIARQAYREKE